MVAIVKLIIEHDLLNKDQNTLNKLKKRSEPFFVNDTVKIYKTSLYIKSGILYFIAKYANKKSLYLTSRKKISSEFCGKIELINNVYIQQVEMNYESSLVLKREFPFTAPVSLHNRKTTFGCGDRLGLASPGHIRAAIRYDVYPVLAQQSIRELTLTKRNYNQVTAYTSFSVFQEGYEKGYGADGDHLKTITDIDIALRAGMPMITLDLSDMMNSEAANWDERKIDDEFNKIDGIEKERLFKVYTTQSFNVGTETISFNYAAVKRCTVIYKRALDFAKKVDIHLKKNRGSEYDLEISIDETITPTLPSHHLFIIKELNHRKVKVNSLAPRFIGEFQKGIDYIGNLHEFEKQFKIHCEIARAHGNYKISIHSGSDKFSVYPIIGKYTNMRLHVKTAGTSWLEAVRCIAFVNPGLYRKMHKKAFTYYNDALKLYHISADITKIKNIDEVDNKAIPQYLDQNESRQLIHITYGGLLNDPEIRTEFFKTLNEHEELHYELLEKHIGNHMDFLGIPPAK